MCKECEKFENTWKEENKGKEPVDECKCNAKDRKDSEYVVHMGNYPELFEYCENCGGVIV